MRCAWPAWPSWPSVGAKRESALDGAATGRERAGPSRSGAGDHVGFVTRSVAASRPASAVTPSVPVVTAVARPGRTARCLDTAGRPACATLKRRTQARDIVPGRKRRTTSATSHLASAAASSMWRCWRVVSPQAAWLRGEPVSPSGRPAQAGRSVRERVARRYGRRVADWVPVHAGAPDVRQWWPRMTSCGAFVVPRGGTQCLARDLPGPGNKVTQEVTSAPNLELMSAPSLGSTNASGYLR